MEEKVCRVRWRRRIISKLFNYGCDWWKKLYLHLPLLVTHPSVLSARLLIQRLCGSRRRHRGKTSSARTTESFQQNNTAYLVLRPPLSFLSCPSDRWSSTWWSLWRTSPRCQKSPLQDKQRWYESTETLQHVKTNRWVTQTRVEDDSDLRPAAGLRSLTRGH